MIIIGADFYGPELMKTPLGEAIRALMQAEASLTEHSAEGTTPAIHVVFCVAGSLGEPDWNHARILRYLTPRKLLLIRIAIGRSAPNDQPHSFGFLMTEVWDACHLAKAFYNSRGLQFDLNEAARMLTEIWGKAGLGEVGAVLPSLGTSIGESPGTHRTQERKPKEVVTLGGPEMSSQLVLQWPAAGVTDFDAMVAAEDALIEGLSSSHEVDGHDFGSGEMNIFIHTTAPKKAFSEARKILEEAGMWHGVRAGYRRFSEEDYKPLWPKGLKEFKVL